MADALEKKANPVVFVSSTAEDLGAYRAAVRDTLLATAYTPRMQEYFVASGAKPPLPACLDKVDEADVVVVLVAHRYGWIPPDQASGGDKSITWLECEHAASEGKEILPFFIEPGYTWPEEQRDRHAIAAAIERGADVGELNELTADVKRRVERLEAFKRWLDSKWIRKHFTTPDDLRANVSEALHEWWKRQPGLAAAAAPRDPAAYLRRLLADTSFIDIRGLQVGTGRAHRFPIEDLFVTLTASGALGEAERPGEEKRGASRKAIGEGAERLRASVPLERALSSGRLVVIGDPGSGKTTFLSRIAAAVCRAWLGGDRSETATWLGSGDPPFPILASLAALADHIKKDGRKDAAACLASYAASWCEEKSLGLDEEFFRRKLEDGPALVLLDGLDEAPDRVVRERLARSIESLARTFDRCRFVVTCRPAAWVASTVLPDFDRVTIEPLGDASIERFFEHWCRSLHPESPESAAGLLGELLAAVRTNPAIRLLARNPVMLTALAVVQWNEKRIPEQRADLYESILTWLSRSREKRPGRVSAERSLALLQEVALAMQIAAGGRKIQLSRREAAESIAGESEWRTETPKDRLAGAERFLVEEEVDSGIVVSRGHDLRFWHLTFQEYLAARAIGARTDAEQRALLGPGSERLYGPEWRETALLLTGILHQQGRQKVDALVGTLLDGLGSTPALADRARCAGLLGAVRRDLRPLGYEPADSRYAELLHVVMGIFDRERSRSVPVEQRIEAADALGQAGDPRLDPQAPGRWVDIPGGRVLLGTQKENPSAPNYDPDAQDDESIHQVDLDPFRIARYPVTVEEFARFVDGGGYDDRRWWTAGEFGSWTKPDGWDEQKRHPSRPVVGVSWFEAAAYAAWSGARLPTEAEWERAARGTSGRIYPWGDEPADRERLNYLINVGHPTPVGIYPQGGTPEGIQDLAGNVWEWCWDWYGEYARDPQQNPRGAADGQYRVLRGGSWFDSEGFARAASRRISAPGFRSDFFGFRVVCSSPISL